MKHSSAFHPPALPDLVVPSALLAQTAPKFCSEEQGGAPRESFLAIDPTLKDYQFVTCLERGPLGETWKVRDTAEKQYWAVILFLDEHADNERSLMRLQAVEHQGVAPFRLLRSSDHRYVLLTPCQGRTLRDVFTSYWTKGCPGIPAEELIGYFRQAASTLDALYRRYRMQHLRLNPRHFLIDGNGKLLISGFGLVEMLWLPLHLPVPPLNPRYTAPELYHQRRTGQCDQFSLALMYGEMRTGVHPLRRPDPNRQGNWSEADFDLRLLSDGEREVLGRALSRNPFLRFASCSDLVTALEARVKSQPWLDSSRPPPLEPLIIAPQLVQAPAASAFTCSSVPDFVERLLRLAERSLPEVIASGGANDPFWTCRLPLAPGTKRLPSLERIVEKWKGQTLERNDRHWLFAVAGPSNPWKKLLGKEPGLFIDVQREEQLAPVPAVEAVITFRPYFCSSRLGQSILDDMAPGILEDLRGKLPLRSDQRRQARHPLRKKLRIQPVINGLQLAEAIDCYAKDVSPQGIGFHVGRSLPSQKVYVSFPDLPEIAHYSSLVHVIRKQRYGSGTFEFGGLFEAGKK